MALTFYHIEKVAILKVVACFTNMSTKNQLTSVKFVFVRNLKNHKVSGLICDTVNTRSPVHKKRCKKWSSCRFCAVVSYFCKSLEMFMFCCIGKNTANSGLTFGTFSAKNSLTAVSCTYLQDRQRL